MARQASQARLSALNWDSALEPVVRALVNRAVGLTGFVQGEVRALDPKPLRAELTGLLAYAQRGHGYRPRVEHSLLRLCDALYRRAADGARPADALGFVLAEARLDEPLGVVVLAAVGRVQLAEQREVPAPCLAALGELSVDHLRLLTRRGRLPALRDSARVGLRYPAHVARTFLLQQRVPGLLPPPEVGAQVRVLGHDPRPLRLHPPPSALPPRVGELGEVVDAPNDDARAVRFADGATFDVNLRWLAPPGPPQPEPPTLA
jgi:hypothetical protein